MLARAAVPARVPTFNCTAGTYSSGIGMTTLSTCSNCSAGAYSSGIEMITASTCSNCTYGTYSSGTGMTTSVTCFSCRLLRLGNNHLHGVLLLHCRHVFAKLTQTVGLSPCCACTPSVNLSVSASSTACNLCGTCSVGEYVNTACNTTANVTCAQCPALDRQAPTGPCRRAACRARPTRSAPRLPLGAIMCQGCPANTWSTS